MKWTCPSPVVEFGNNIIIPEFMWVIMNLTRHPIHAALHVIEPVIEISSEALPTVSPKAKAKMHAVI